LGIKKGNVLNSWKLLAGVLAPLCVALVFINTLFPEIFGVIGSLSND